MSFMFENLEVHKRGIEFAKGVFLLAKGFRERAIKDQLCRAALSIPLNVAEGNGRIHLKEKRQYFYTARGSLLECVSIIQLCKELEIIGAADYDSLYSLATQISKMLGGLIKSLENRESSK